MTSLLPQQNDWTCLPTSVEYALGVPREEFMRDVGHDGSEILYPWNPEPSCHRAFNLDEQLRWATDRGYKHQFFSLNAREAVGPNRRYASNQPMLWDLIQNHPAVCTVRSRRFAGVLHAIGWDGRRFLDPRTGGVEEYSANDLLDAHVFYYPALKIG